MRDESRDRAGEDRKSFHRHCGRRWRQSIADAQHSKFHFIDDGATAPHHLRVELIGEKPPGGTLTLNEAP
ncbi:hypothetical protein [Bradyrhizobium sp. STM 3562]|uniref:hypothetical protein n=1 Tax=Bradyrhizobium sp. STM 3562 TaxID=578924 RepID=UPI00388DCF94